MEFEPIASGYCFLEAPRADGDSIWFTDLLQGGLYRLSPDGNIETFLEGRTNIGGAVLNQNGSIICGGLGGLVYLDPASGKFSTLLEAIDGHNLSGVNDMYPDGKGGLYFGTSTSAEEFEALESSEENEQDAGPHKIYRLDKNGDVFLMDKGLKIANGMGLSPDGKHLYHSESLVGTFVYDVHEDGSLSNKSLFSAQEDGDGLAVDAEGGVWVAYYDSGAIVRYLPDGSVDMRVPVPQKVVTSLCFGGADWRDLYVTTAGNDGVGAMMRGEMPAKEACLYHARVDIPGLPVPRTQFQLPLTA